MRTWIVTLLTAASLVALGGCYYPGYYHGYTSVGVSGYYGAHDYYPYPYAYGYPYPYYYGHGSVIVTRPYYRPVSPVFVRRDRHDGWRLSDIERRFTTVPRDQRRSYDKRYSRINPWQADDDRHDRKVRDNRDGRKGKRSFEGHDVCFGRHC